jgi:hypothetical protein
LKAPYFIDAIAVEDATSWVPCNHISERVPATDFPSRQSGIGYAQLLLLEIRLMDCQ